MKKNMKKIIGIAFSFVLCLSTIISVNAAEQREKSYVDMPGGSTLTGKSRSYNYANHKISLKPTRLDFSKQDSQGGYVQVDIGLDKKGWLFWDNDVASGTVVLRELSKTYNLSMGKRGKGTFRYTFYTGNAVTSYGGFRADPVYMYSYE